MITHSPTGWEARLERTQMRMVFIVALTVAGSASLTAHAAGARGDEVPAPLTTAQMDTVTAGSAGVDALANAFVVGTSGRTSAATNAFASTNRLIDIARGSASAFACCTPLVTTTATADVYGTGDNVFFNRIESGSYFQTNRHAAASTRGTGSAIAFGQRPRAADATLDRLPGFALPLRP